MELLFSIYFFIFGLLIGSFLNVVIIRLPQKLDLVAKRSGCPQCGRQLRWYHNIPLLSFLALRGKCAFCGKAISWRYPLIELLTGLVALWLMPADLNLTSLGLFTFFFTIACIFICHFFIDLDHQLLLDSLNLYLLAVFLSYSILLFHWSYWLVGGLLGFGAPLLVTWLFYKIRGQVGLGGGDIKLYGILGLYLGPMGIFFNIFLSCFVGAVVGVLLISMKRMTKDKPMAFGPAILLVAAFQIFFPEHAHKLLSLLF
ncbi:MAG TPA: prepilin peptidase [Bacteriovoracaceae bacterium]|nr:prepilin peptidase [Bacteriovoracaceae bacterium]